MYKRCAKAEKITRIFGFNDWTTEYDKTDFEPDFEVTEDMFIAKIVK